VIEVGATLGQKRGSAGRGAQSGQHQAGLAVGVARIDVGALG
jgi:hypothetical protein